MRLLFVLLVWIVSGKTPPTNSTTTEEAAAILNTEVDSLLAFPGAEGFGAYSQGGRGGQVYHVTNLNDSGPGSLRWAVRQEGPRTVVFDVSGIIDLKTQLTITNPYITIAGQTAPGDGICLRGETLRVEADEVIIRYLRARLGDGKHGVGSLQGKDAISVASGKNIIIDHCSTSWSLDEVLSTSTHRANLTNVSIQWCFITEALNPDGHGYGALIRGTNGARYSYLYNLFAHNQGRNPRPGNYDSHPHTEDSLGLLLDFRNNVIYNWGGDHAGYNADKKSVTRFNYVGNYLIPGPNSHNNGVAYSAGSPYNQAYFAQNVYDEKMPENQWALVHFKADRSAAENAYYQRSEPFATGPVANLSAIASYQEILESGGAYLPKRDAIDQRIVEEVRQRSGKIINSQEDVGGWVAMKSAEAPSDTDQDGMPDMWEIANGLDKDNPEDRNAVAANGYTMLENYLNGH